MPSINASKKDKSGDILISPVNGNKTRILDKIKHPALLYNFVNWMYDRFGRGKDFSVQFKKLFFEKEIGELYGKKNGNFWKIVLLYLTLFVSVGFGIQSKNYFNKQLDNPFVRFLSVPIVGEAKTVPELLDSLQTKYLQRSIRKKFHLDTIRSISIENPAAFASDFVQLDVTGMADDYNSSMVTEAVCSKENFYIGKPFGTVEDRSVIVTLDLLKDLYLIGDSAKITDLTTNDLPGYLMFKPSFFSTPIPIVLQGVADQLPYGHNFLLSTKFNDYLYSDPYRIFCDTSALQISFYIDTLIDQEKLKNVLVPVAQSQGIITDEFNFYIEKTTGIHSTMLVCFKSVPEKRIAAKMMKDTIIKTFNVGENQIADAFYIPYDYAGTDYVFGGNSNQATKNSMLIIFKDLKKVKDFNNELKSYSSAVITNALNLGSTKQRKGIEMEMANVNMRFILNIIEIIVTSFLFIIGVLAVTSLISFIRVLFEKYFQKIEKNIGTFMAFGINIKVVYSIMLTIFVIITVIISLVLALAVGNIAEFAMIKLIGNSAQEGLSLFSLANIYTIVALIAIILANIIAFRQASRIFSKWPGDIINDR